MKHNKLVRDRIPEMIRQKGEVSVTHIANDEEYYAKLKEKLMEEVNEFLESDKPEELADIMEVIFGICDFKNIEKEQLEVLRKQKVSKKGAFRDKIILDKTKS